MKLDHSDVTFETPDNITTENEHAQPIISAGISAICYVLVPFQN